MGLGVAEAMDTAQRGMGLDWPTSLELIRRTLDAARDVPGALVAIGLRHRSPRARRRAQRRRRDPRLRRADGGDRAARRPAHPDGQPRARARRARPGRLRARLRPLLRQARQPVILHWLGDMFDPALRGYWGSDRSRPRRWTLRSASSRRTPRRSTASRSRCSTRTRKSRCAAACRPACACTPATTSTTPS